MSLIINTPYVCPAQHWVDAPGGKLVIKPERRPASYEVFDARNNTKRTEVLALVNTIRARVDAWREAGWPGVTIVTRKLLEHWHDREARQLPFYFCQLEAIETLIWWVEGAEAFKQGIAIPGDGGTWERLCNKMPCQNRLVDEPGPSRTKFKRRFFRCQCRVVSGWFCGMAGSHKRENARITGSYGSTPYGPQCRASENTGSERTLWGHSMA